MYKFNSANIIQIGIFESKNLEIVDKEIIPEVGLESSNTFQNLFSLYIMNTIAIHKNITLETITLDAITSSINECNFIFYVTHINDIINSESSVKINTDIKTIESHMTTDNKNHLFIVVDGCDDMSFDDDGDLVFSDKSMNIKFKKFSSVVNSILGSKTVDICRLGIRMAKIYLQYLEDKSIVNLSAIDIDLLSGIYIKKASRMAIADKKRELKIALKKEDMDTKLSETGYMETLDAITKYFKIVHQKKIVCKNYLHAVDICPVNITSESVENIKNLLNEIFAITYLKPDMFSSLTGKVELLLKTKLDQFYCASRRHIAIESELLTSIDAYAYNNFLLSCLDIDCIKNDLLPEIKKMINSESELLNKMIVSHYNKEVGKIIDLDKISIAFKIFSVKDKDNIPGLFEKMRSNPQIIVENMAHMDKWVTFIDNCIKLGIKSEPIIDLIECIIIEKIKCNVDMSKANRPEMSAIYPYCLQTFLLKNLSAGFVFDKLYMFLSCNIRYSGRNLPELIQKLSITSYNALLVLENKLLEIVKL